MSVKPASPTKTKRRTPTKASPSDPSFGPSSTRHALLQAGKKLFARRGLSGTSIRDIAREAKINSSLISYYFDGKEGLYRECLKDIGETRVTLAQAILQSPESLEEFKIRLKLFAENLMALFLEDREAGLIIIREFDRIHSPAEKVFKDTFFQIFDLIQTFFVLAQKNRLIEKNKDPFVLASLFFGALSNEMRIDHLKESLYHRTLKDPEEKKKMLEHLIGLFTVA